MSRAVFISQINFNIYHHHCYPLPALHIHIVTKPKVKQTASILICLIWKYFT